MKTSNHKKLVGFRSFMGLFLIGFLMVPPAYSQEVGMLGGDYLASGYESRSNTAGKWLKFGEFTINGDWCSFMATVDIYPRNSNHGDSRQTITIGFRNNREGIEPTYSVELFDIAGQQRSISDVQVVHHEGAGVNNNVLAIWMQMGTSWLTGVPYDLRVEKSSCATLSWESGNKPYFPTIQDEGEVYGLTAYNGKIGGKYAFGQGLEVKTGDQDGIRITSQGIPRLELDGWEGDELKSNWVLYSRPSNGEFGIWDDNQRGNRLTIDSLGKVGIGTRYPQQKLHIHGKLLSEAGQPGIVLKEVDGATDENWWIDNHNGYFRILTANDALNSWQAALKINQVAGTPKSIYLAGNVGIGTTDPQAKLAVDGDILATKVKVVTDVNAVPDYVFEDDYDLTTLEEVADYIQANKHLPEVPSASEMAEAGQDLGAMNLLLLKKIEELTLYLIEERKENQQQRRLLEQQQERIQHLTTELESLKTSQP